MASDASDAKIEQYITVMTQMLSTSADEVQGALGLIAAGVREPRTSLGMRLLALRRYLRMGESKVVAQWAWTPEKVAQERASGDVKVLYELAGATQRAFVTNNPGFNLLVSPLRSLAKQVGLWITNGSVREASAKLLEDVRTELSKDLYTLAPTSISILKFRRALSQMTVRPEPKSAAPGTSDHGQGHAVDFVVVQGRHQIAGTETKDIAGKWKRDGWERKLIDAIAACNEQQRKGSTGRVPILSGPLKKPYEPWHWVLCWEDAAQS
ncbi:MAG TPA: hypothetical protein VI299_06520 [Polyangiales bacterium]